LQCFNFPLFISVDSFPCIYIVPFLLFFTLHFSQISHLFSICPISKKMHKTLIFRNRYPLFAGI
jgi:hypothetical protein